MLARYGPASAEQTLGALPVVAAFCRKLDIAGIIDRAAPVRPIARASHGQVIEALIANRLTSPAPIIHVAAWARQFAVGHALGLDPGVLNDDRIARALDALAPVLEEVTGSVGAAAIAAYGIDVSQLHWDMTSVSLYGQYEAAEQEYAQPRFGHPKDRRADLRQIQAGVAAGADGAVPLFWRPYDGGAGEVSQVTGAMEALRRLAGPRRFLLVGDSKLLSYANIAAMVEAKVSFLAPASKAFVPAAVLAGCDYTTATPADFAAERDRAQPEARRGHYRLSEDTMTITGPRKRDPSYTVRRVFVYSSARAEAAAHARARKLDRARDDLSRLTRGLGSRHYPTAAKVTARVAAIARDRHVGDYLHATAGSGDDGRPTLKWHFNQAAIDAEAATDGWYALLTNLDAQTVPASQVLARYQNQPGTSERRYHDLKGPLAVAPMFLHANRRITAIIGVVCMALLIYCLAERQARRGLAPDTTLDGLYAGRAAKPTASLIFTTLATLRLRTRPTTAHPRYPSQTQSSSVCSTCSKSIPGDQQTHPTPCANYGASRRRGKGLKLRRLSCGLRLVGGPAVGERALHPAVHGNEACRALVYLNEGRIVSKIAGGLAALDRGIGPPGLIRRALDQQQGTAPSGRQGPMRSCSSGNRSPAQRRGRRTDTVTVIVTATGSGSRAIGPAVASGRVCHAAGPIAASAATAALSSDATALALADEVEMRPELAREPFVVSAHRRAAGRAAGQLAQVIGGWSDQQQAARSACPETSRATPACPGSLASTAAR